MTNGITELTHQGALCDSSPLCHGLPSTSLSILRTFGPNLTFRPY
jgi:hypothetical protein